MRYNGKNDQGDSLCPAYPFESLRLFNKKKLFKNEGLFVWKNINQYERDEKFILSAAERSLSDCATRKSSSKMRGFLFGKV